ncbi:hypothetical protein MAR_016759 [Mya arenaria]|uniref:C2H2-type domain-containing protein n=1 Tax=Mya arenaria TaxID=6604 RepID=A0ABY7ED43_MYAAR|nr:hypothetical protein MAR_016759 [Mya arenaria]
MSILRSVAFRPKHLEEHELLHRVHRELDLLSGDSSPWEDTLRQRDVMNEPDQDLSRAETTPERGDSAYGPDTDVVPRTSTTVHPCDLCGKNYGARSSLMRHQREGHRQSHHKCVRCQRSFTRAKVKTRADLRG